MKRLSFFLCSWLMALWAMGVTSAQAQAPAWQVAITMSPGSGIGKTATDASGNVYLVGAFEGTAYFGSIRLDAAASTLFVAKWNSTNGQFVWARPVGGGKRPAGIDALAVNGHSIYLAGVFSGQATDTFTFGDAMLTGPNGENIFVAKLTDTGTAGRIDWVRQEERKAGPRGLCSVTGLVVQGTSLYLAGNFDQTIRFGGTTLTSAGGHDGFIAKLTDSGRSARFDWAQQFGGNSSDFVYAMAVIGTSLYLAGSFDRAATFGSLNLEATKEAGRDMFVVKLFDTGHSSRFVWGQRIGGSHSAQASALAVTGGSVYVAGSFTNEVSFGGSLRFLPNDVEIIHNREIFVAKLTDQDSTAAIEWVQHAGGPQETNVEALLVNGLDVYLAGTFTGTASFGSTALTSMGFMDVFVAKFTDAGRRARFDWATRAGGSYGDWLDGLALTSNGNLYVALSGITPTLFGQQLAPGTPCTQANYLAVLEQPQSK